MVGLGVLVSVPPGVATEVMVAVAVAGGSVPPAGVPVAVATLVTVPAVTSAAVIV